MANNRANKNGRNIKPVEMVTKNLNKKGRLKGKNKAETKTLVGICAHHVVNKKGSLKAKISVSNGWCNCDVCGARFKADFYSDEEAAKKVNGMKELNNQSKFMAVAIGAGADAVDYFSNTGAMLENYLKGYKKLRGVAEKQQSVKSKKKKKSNGGSSQYGSWGRN